MIRTPVELQFRPLGPAFRGRSVRPSMKIEDLGAQWLSGRVLDSRPRGRGIEPHRRHCVVVL